MIWYVTLWTNNFDMAVKFYDALLWEIWGSRFLDMENFVAWTNKAGEPGVSVIKPFDGKVATAWNGSMTAIKVDSNDEVDRLYKKAIELGATDEWEAGIRGEGAFYAWYFRDLDGNKLNFFHVNSM